MIRLSSKYGVMNSGRTIEVLKVAHNYEEQNKPTASMTSGIDTRDGLGVVSSRVGLKREAMSIFEETGVFDAIQNMEGKPYCVLINRAQFLRKKHATAFTRIIDKLDIPVMVSGLKNDFRDELSEGSKYLLLYTDKIEEMKTTCWFCHKGAIVGLRYVGGEPAYEDDQV